MPDYRQLTRLARPFQDALVHDNPGAGNRGSYVTHSVVTQRLLDVLGPVSFEVAEVVRGDTKDGKYLGVVVGVLASMRATVDGQPVTVTEVGDCESPGNWPHDGARLKDAASDAYKRCAMRLGVGLHLWAGSEFYLADRLRKQDESGQDEGQS